MFNIMKFIEKNSLKSLILLIFISGCGGSDGDNEVLEPSIKPKLVGLWERTFERNGSTGIQQIEITSDGFLQSNEIGDYLIMNEWYSSLPDGITYKFWSDPKQPISEVTDNTITASAVSGAAHIIVLSSGEEVATWAISSLSSQVSYQLSSNGNLLTITTGDTTLEFNKS